MDFAADFGAGFGAAVTFAAAVDFGAVFGFGDAADFVVAGFGAAAFRALPVVGDGAAPAAAGDGSFAAAFGADARVEARPSFGAFTSFAAGAGFTASTSGATGDCGSSSGGADATFDADALEDADAFEGVDAPALAVFFPRNTGFAPGSGGTSPSMGVRSLEYFELMSLLVCAGCFAALDARLDSSENCFTSSEARFSSSENREGVDGGRSTER